jgi:hypothetical protein
MTVKIINEGLDYRDLEGQLADVVSIDEYAAKMGDDSDIVTIAFIVNSHAAGEDLVEWFERGYDWVLDAQVSEGELVPGKYIVFVETKRRLKVPERVIELLEDLETLTGYKLTDWTVKVADEEHDADEEILKQVLTLSPQQYRDEVEDEEGLNEMRERAGLDVKPLHADKQDAEIRAFKSIAGL